jgi:hypothetical protein
MSKKSIPSAQLQVQSLQFTPQEVNSTYFVEKKLLTAQELLDQELDNVITYDQLLILTKQGLIPYVTLGSRRFYRRQTILDWFAEMEKESVSFAKTADRGSILKVLEGGRSA